MTSRLENSNILKSPFMYSYLFYILTYLNILLVLISLLVQLSLLTYSVSVLSHNCSSYLDSFCLMFLSKRFLSKDMWVKYHRTI